MQVGAAQRGGPRGKADILEERSILEDFNDVLLLNLQFHRSVTLEGMLGSWLGTTTLWSSGTPSHAALFNAPESTFKVCKTLPLQNSQAVLLSLHQEPSFVQLQRRYCCLRYTSLFTRECL
jgi:hypothetical protein